MEYDDDYKLSMNAIIDEIKHKPLDELSEDSRQIVEKIYKDITSGIKFAERIVTEANIKLLTGNKMIYPVRVKFMSSEIYLDISNNMIEQIIFSCDMNSRYVTITIGIMRNNQIKMEELILSVKRTISWLFVCDKYTSNDDSKTRTVSLYFTGIKRAFPNNNSVMLDPSNVNGGVSYTEEVNSSNITVYRYEEWFKVFVHECGHSYGFESHNLIGDQLYEFTKKLISIEVSDRIGEAYVETWARIILVFYSAIENSIDYDDFMLPFKFNMKVESIFSAIQSFRVLAFMRIPYRDVITSTSTVGKKYKETTNIFSYFILCGAFMQDPFKFMNLCNTYNKNLFHINNVEKFKEYIKTMLYNKNYEALMEKFAHLANRKTGLRFTITELPKKLTSKQ